MSIETEFQSTIQNVQNAYNGLNNLGATIPQNKTIENIKSCLDEIYDNLPKTEYQEGTNITLSNTLKGKLDFEDDKVGYGQTSQDGEPTPSSPIPIKCVTGNQDVVESGKNLFKPVLTIDGTNIGVNNSSLTQVINGEFSFVASGSDLFFGNVRNEGMTYEKNRGIKIYRNGNSKISYRCSNDSFNKNFFTAYDKSDISLGYTMVGSGGTGTYTFPDNCEYVTFRFGNGSAVSGTTYKTKVILAYGDEIPTYEPYITPTTYQLSLGDRKVFEDDYFWRDNNGKFYHHHAYQYELFKNGTINRMQTTVSGKYRFSIEFSKLAKAVLNNDVVADIYSNILIKNSGNQIYQAKNGIGINMSGAIHFYYDSFSAYTIEEMTSYFSNKNDYIVYPLAEETDEEITDTTLINQLEALYNAHSLNGTTIIESNGNLPMIIKVRALKGE